MRYASLFIPVAGAAPENLQSYDVYVGTNYWGADGPITMDELRISTVARTPDEFMSANIPEPGTFVLLGLSCLGLVIVRRRRRA